MKYGKVAMKKTQVYEWHMRFLDSCASGIDIPVCKQPSTATIDKDIELVRSLYEGSDKRDISESMTISLERSQYPSQRFEHAFPFVNTWLQKC
jgi:hypothetical protein